MKKLLLSIFVSTIGITLSAQVTFHQIGDKEMAAKFAEAPQSFLGSLQQLRGFGCFIKVDKSAEQYDNLVGFYEIGKDEEQYLSFMVTAQLVNEKGKIVAKSNTETTNLRPNQKTILKRLSFSKGTYEKLEPGKYELVISGIPVNTGAREMIRSGNPETRFYFKK